MVKTVLNNSKLIKRGDKIIFKKDEEYELTIEEKDKFYNDVLGNIRIIKEELENMNDKTLKNNIKQIKKQTEKEAKDRKKFLKIVNTSQYKKEYKERMEKNLKKLIEDSKEFIKKKDDIAKLAIENLKKEYEKKIQQLKNQLKMEEENLRFYKEFEERNKKKKNNNA